MRALLLMLLLTLPSVAQSDWVRVDSDPSGALVFKADVPTERRVRDGEGYLGETPTEIPVPRGVSKFSVILEKPGYQSRMEALDLRISRDYDFALSPDGLAQTINHVLYHEPLRALPFILAGLALVVGVVTRHKSLGEQLLDAAARRPSLAGRTIDGYRLEEKAGEGGMADVYRARKNGTLVAVKLLRDADDELRERFAREYAIGSRLDHPNLVRALAVGDFRGAPYLVMDWVEGPTLKDRLEAGPLAPSEALQIAVEIAEGLEFAHEHDVIHRDLKPANIVLDPTVRLLDFGAARMPSGRKLTVTGEVIGTPHYMSPDHLSSSVDHRCDLYSLGVVLYQMLTGRVPFPGEDARQVLAAHLTEKVPDLELDHPMADRLQLILNRALAKTPRRRFNSAREMAQALRELLVQM